MSAYPLLYIYILYVGLYTQPCLSESHAVSSRPPLFVPQCLRGLVAVSLLLPVSVCFWLSVCLYVSACIFLSLSVSFYLFIFLSLSLYVSLCLFLSLSVSVSVPLCLSVSAHALCRRLPSRPRILASYPSVCLDQSVTYVSYQSVSYVSLINQSRSSVSVDVHAARCACLC